MAANGALKIIGGIAIVLSLSYCSELPKYRFERAAAEAGHRIPGARLISSMKGGDLASPVSWFWPATTNWSFAFPDAVLRDRFYTFTLIYNEELSPIVFLVDADCEAREEVLYDLDEPESAFPALDFLGEPVVAPNGKTYRRAKRYTNIAPPPEWLHAFCETDWTAERKAAGLGNADAPDDPREKR
jgi:hypothetical protein